MTNPNDTPPATPPGDTPPAAPATPPASATPPADGTPPQTPPVTPPADSLLKPPVAGDTPPPLLEVIPEKYRVLAADGTLDLEASARKQADAYKALETRMGSGDVRPATPEEYALTPTVEGMDPEEFKTWTQDPLWQGFQTKAHAKGLTNEQLNFVANEYLALAPDIAAAQVALGATEARTELAKLWVDPAELNTNLSSVHKAIQGFGGQAPDMPGSQQRLYNKFANDPDFIAFAATIAKEMPEDRSVNGITPSTQQDIEAVMKSPAYMDPMHADHAATKARVKAFYDKQHGTAPTR